ncbi:MAG: hypothetical protein LUE98_11950 [Tannerellaceae bacterium]|nr:hypothetical protein [Tannerellaceae bacterium]
MKNLVLTGMASLMAACSVTEVTETYKPVECTIQCRIDLLETKATASEAVETLVFVFMNTESNKTTILTQKKGESCFGSITATLDTGTYDCVIIGHNSEVHSLEGTIMTFDKASDTFRGIESFEVEPGDNHTIEVTLSRAITRVETIASDKLPQEASEISFELTGLSNGFDICSGKPETKETINRRFTLRSSDIGKENLKFSINAFTDNKSESKLTIKTYKKDGSLMKETKSPPFIPETNKITRFTGYLFTRSGTPDLGVNIDTEWDEINEYELEN